MNAGWWVGLLLLAAWLLLKRARVSHDVSVTQDLLAPQDAVWASLQDLSQWPAWSPWLLHDADTKTHVSAASDAGQRLTWQSAILGRGEVRTHGAGSDHRLRAELQLHQPLRVHADMSLEVRALDAHHTQVSWALQGRLPLFMAPMKARLQKRLRQDLELGLLRLGGHLNPASPHPKFSFGEVAERVSFHAICHRETTTLQALPQTLDEWLPKLKAQAGSACEDAPLGVYHRINESSGELELSVACPVAESSPGATLIRGGHYFKLTLRGDRRFLRLAWAVASTQARLRGRRWDEHSPALERYVSDPADTPNPNDWLTELYLPVQE